MWGAEAGAARRERDRLGPRARHLVLGRRAHREHPIEHAIAAPPNAVRCAARIIDRGAAGHSYERRGLRERQVTRGLVEPEAARGLDAADARAEEDPVQVLLEDLALAERGLD